MEQIPHPTDVGLLYLSKSNNMFNFLLKKKRRICLITCPTKHDVRQVIRYIISFKFFYQR